MDITDAPDPAQPFSGRADFAIRYMMHEADLAASLQRLLDHPCLKDDPESKLRFIELALDLSLLSGETYDLMLEHNQIGGDA